MGYDASWDSTDQVPQRAIDAGTIGRFDAIDPTDGGETRATASRANGATQRRRRPAALGLSHALPAAAVLELHLRAGPACAGRPVRAKAIDASRPDGRARLGPHRWPPLVAHRARPAVCGTTASASACSTPWRAAHRDHARRCVRETGFGLYVENSLEWTPWLRTVVGLRADAYWADVDSTLDANSGDSDDTQLSPKLSLVFGPWGKTEFFVNAGRGFHSNDARGTTTTIDPKSGDPTDTVPPLVASKGCELGARTELMPGLQSSLALWELAAIPSWSMSAMPARPSPTGQPAPRRGMEQPLDPRALVPARRRLRVDPRALLRIRPGRRPHPRRGRARGLGRHDAARARTLVGHPAVALPRPAPADRRQQRARRLHAADQPARRAQVRPGCDADARCLQPVRPRGQRHRVLLRVAPAGRSGPVADRHVHPVEPRTVRVTLQARF